MRRNRGSFRNFWNGLPGARRGCLNAAWGGVAVFRGRETDLYAAGEEEKAISSTLRSWILSSARENRVATGVRRLPPTEKQAQKTRAVAQRGLCADQRKRRRKAWHFVLADDGGNVWMPKRKSCSMHWRATPRLSLENFRRFSQLEKSKRQWVEDIDAISDYIVVHDRAWKILRTNRSLASHLGVPPVALVGEAMSGLRQIAETGSDLPCPFCRDTQRPREEYVAASAERIFLVSTSTSARRGGRRHANDSRPEGHYRPAGSRAAVPRTVRQHSGRPFLSRHLMGDSWM